MFLLAMRKSVVEVIGRKVLHHFLQPTKQSIVGEIDIATGPRVIPVGSIPFNWTLLHERKRDFELRLDVLGVAGISDQR